MSRGPLEIGLADLLRRPGTQREVRVSATIGDLELEALEVHAGPEAAVDLVLDSITDGLVVTGTVRAPWTGSCRRCLAPVSGDVVAEVRDIYSTSLERDGVADDADVRPMPTTDVLDLADTVRETLLLALPLAPLCGDDCAGPDPDRFPAVGGEAEHDTDGDEPPRDPRWAALDALRVDPGPPDQS